MTKSKTPILDRHIEEKSIVVRGHEYFGAAIDGTEVCFGTAFDKTDASRVEVYLSYHPEPQDW